MLAPRAPEVADGGFEVPTREGVHRERDRVEVFCRRFLAVRLVGDPRQKCNRDAIGARAYSEKRSCAHVH